MQTMTSDLESLILLLLDADRAEPSIPGKTIRAKGVGVLTQHDQGEMLPFDPMVPVSAYTCALGDERLIALSTEYLVRHPAETLGDEAQVVMLCGNYIKWCGFRKVRKVPKGLACLGRPDCWYEFHYRTVVASGESSYIRRLIPLSASGAPMAAKLRGHPICDPQRDGVTLTIAASIIEDAHRPNAMLAAVKDATEIKFPVPLDDYQRVFAAREGPLSGSRRKAIVHWVGHHLRSSTQGRIHTVKRHARGVREFEFDGLTISITPNGGGE